MATCYFIGNAPLRTKILRAAAPVSANPVTVGFPGGPVISLSTWSAANVVAAWNALNHPLRNLVTAEADGTAVKFTASQAGQDFHIRGLISGAAESDVPQITADELGSGPSFFMNAENWKDGVVPGSEDTIIIDQGESAILYDIDLVQPFVKFNESGGFVNWQLTSKKPIFVQNQKVRVESSTTLPSGLSAGFYYVRNPLTDGKFQLSTGTSDAGRITTSDAGTGTHKIGLYDVQCIVYARFAGRQIGLPKRRSNMQEYLPRYLNCWFKRLVIGDAFLGGNGLSLGNFDAETSAIADGLIVDQTQPASTTVPSVSLLLNNSAIVLQQRGGSVGLSPYADESCLINYINQTGGTLLISNTTTTSKSRLLPKNYDIYNSTIAGVTNVFTP